MKDDLREFARLGLVHHMLYPRCTDDAAHHAATLREFVTRSDIETFDCCLPYGNKWREKLVAAIRASGKADVTFATHLFPLRKISLASTSPAEQGLIRVWFQDQINQAAEIGATGFIFASGADLPEAERPAGRRAFSDFCRWFCEQLRPHGITALLEPFDRTFDKKFLYGPTSECVELIRSLAPDVDNLGIEGGEIDVPQLVQILRALRKVGYLSAFRRGALVLEMQPFPGQTPDQTVTASLARLACAWAEA